MRLPVCRAVLFAPASRPDLLAKVSASGADAMVADLEDGVAPQVRGRAREDLRAALPALADGMARVWVRVNPTGSTDFEADLTVLSALVDAVVVPKVEAAAQVQTMRAALAAQGLADLALVAGIETGRGVLAAVGIAEAADGVYFGAEDYVADIGGRRRPDGLEVLWARSAVAVAARVAGVPALDQVVLAPRDTDAVLADATFGRDLGYSGKMCIHPAQVAAVQAAYRPTAAEVAEASRIVDAHRQALADGAGVVLVDGKMVDEPLVAQARAVIEAASMPTSHHGGSSHS